MKCLPKIVQFAHVPNQVRMTVGNTEAIRFIVRLAVVAIFVLVAAGFGPSIQTTPDRRSASVVGTKLDY